MEKFTIPDAKKYFFNPINVYMMTAILNKKSYLLLVCQISNHISRHFSEGAVVLT